MKYYQQESKLAVQSGDVRGRVQLLANIGNEYSTQRNYEAGMRYLREGVQRGGECRLPSNR